MELVELQESWPEHRSYQKDLKKKACVLFKTAPDGLKFFQISFSLVFFNTRGLGKGDTEN